MNQFTEEKKNTRDKNNNFQASRLHEYLRNLWGDNCNSLIT